MLNIFNRKKSETPASPSENSPAPAVPTNPVNPANPVQDQTGLAEIALNSINDGVIITDKNGVIEFINPAAVVMTDVKAPSNAIGLDSALLLKIETKEGREQASAKYEEEAAKVRRNENLKKPVIIIKSTPQASYGALVEILDEMQINSISKYQIDNMTKVDSVLLIDYQNRHHK